MTKIHDYYNGFITSDKRRKTVRKARQTKFEKDFPVPRQIVYIIKDENEEIIYVGETVNGPRRLAEHFGYDKTKAFHKGQFKKQYCKEFWTYEVIETFTKEERLIKEIELEFKYQPKFNKRWKTI